MVEAVTRSSAADPVLPVLLLEGLDDLLYFISSARTVWDAISQTARGDKGGVGSRTQELSWVEEGGHGRFPVLR